MDELYESTPWLLCPFGGEDEACTCMRCRTEKWPERYSSWNLSEQQINEVESMKPGERKEWAIGEHLLADSGNADNGSRNNERNGGLAAQVNEDRMQRDAEQATMANEMQQQSTTEQAATVHGIQQQSAEGQAAAVSGV